MYEKSSHDVGKLAYDQSSVCAELDHDPDKTLQRLREEEREKRQYVKPRLLNLHSD